MRNLKPLIIKKKKNLNLSLSLNLNQIINPKKIIIKNR